MTGAPAAGDRLATLAAWLGKGGWPAAAVLAALTVALFGALLLPGAVLLLPLALAGNVAGISLLALEAGLPAALRTLALMILLLAPLVLVGGAPALGPALLFAWLPGLVGGLVLRSARSLPLALFTLTVGAVVVVLVVNQTGLPAGEPQTRQSLIDTLSRLNPNLSAAQLGATLDLMLQLAGGLLALVLLGAWTAGLGLGRSLQARLRRPGAFGQEFRALRLGRAYSVLVLVAVAAAFGLRLAGGGLAVELALVLAVPLVLQGLALMHAHIARLGRWRRLPWAVYLMLVLATLQVGSLLAILGLVDNWLDFRNRPPR